MDVLMTIRCCQLMLCCMRREGGRRDVASMAQLLPTFLWLDEVFCLELCRELGQQLLLHGKGATFGTCWLREPVSFCAQEISGACTSCCKVMPQSALKAASSVGSGSSAKLFCLLKFQPRLLLPARFSSCGLPC